MSLTKKFTGDYGITSIGTQGNVNLTALAVNIHGALNVIGQATYTQVGQSAVTDNFITLNAGLPPDTVPSFDAGISVNRGSFANVEIRWHELTGTWQITNDGTTYSNIASLTPANTILELDPSPKLGGNLNTVSREIYSSTSNVIRFTDNIAIKTTTVAPDPLIGNTIVYAQSVGSGNAGLYVANPGQSLQKQELITKNRALAFALFM
jgi:hypothetical protein